MAALLRKQLGNVRTGKNAAFLFALFASTKRTASAPEIRPITYGTVQHSAVPRQLIKSAAAGGNKNPERICSTTIGNTTVRLFAIKSSITKTAARKTLFGLRERSASTEKDLKLIKAYIIIIRYIISGAYFTSRLFLFI